MNEAQLPHLYILSVCIALSKTEALKCAFLGQLIQIWDIKIICWIYYS